MDFIIEDFNKCNQKDVAGTIERAFALATNMSSVEDYKGRKGVFTEDDIKCIKNYGDDYPDEFYIDLQDDVDSGAESSDGHTLYIEVLSAESAEYNEREYMSDHRFTDEDKKNYKLGETVQWYSPLGDSGFWYCLK